MNVAFNTFSSQQSEALNIEQFLDVVLADSQAARACLTCSFQAEDVIVWINGYGWPVYRGGPMFHADTVGLPQVVARLEAYGPRLGKDFTISPLLRQLAAG